MKELKKEQELMNENNLLKEQMEKFDEIQNENKVLKDKLKEV